MTPHHTPLLIDGNAVAAQIKADIALTVRRHVAEAIGRPVSPPSW